MKKNIKAILLLIIPLAIASVLIWFLPDKIPVQLTVNGTKYTSKWIIFLFAVLPFGNIFFFKIKKKLRGYL